MRFGAVSTITFLFAAGMAACSPKAPLNEATPASGGAGGRTTSSSGGAKSSGGTSGTGDSVASGGSTSSSSGGATSPGGSTSFSSGGAVASGGSTSTASGGVVASGGSTSSTVSSGNCTDVAPPNQTPTCADWLSYNTCSADWFKGYCNKTCGRCSGGSPGGATGGGGIVGSGGVTGRGGSGGTSNAGGTVNSGGATSSGGGVSSGTNPPITGSNGFATRYWDCCKPSCAWTTSVPSCGKDGTTRISDKNAKSGCDSGGSAYECYDFSPWFDSSTNMSYGFVAHNGVACGTCFQLQFTGEGNSGTNAGATALKGQQMIVQAINIGGIDSNQFDILIPGGGVGAMTAGCTAQWGSSTDLGQTYGGLLAECKNDAACMKGKCQSVFGSFPALLAGCNWFTGWYSSADNPKVIYKKVTCPSQITSKSGLSG